MKFNPLICILNPRQMEKPVAAFKALKGYDKLYAQNMVQIEAYNRLRNYFLDNKQYTHLVLVSDDAEIKQKNMDTLKKDVEKTGHDVISGICNVDMKDDIDSLAACLSYVDPVWGRRNYDFVKKGQLKGIHRVAWSGFPLTSISRKVVKKIPFRNDAELNKHDFGQSYDVMFSHDLRQGGIPVYVNFDNFFWHLKGQGGFDTFGVKKRSARLIFENENVRDIIYERPADNPKLVATIVVYNEEENIEDCLHSLQQIEDLDDVYVLDGRYCDDGFTGNNSSTDRTREIVSTSRIGLFNKYFIGAQRWKSQAHKRNWLWDFIERKENTDCWFLIIDGDEELVLPSNRRSMRLKPLLSKVKEDFVILESGPHGDNMAYPLEYFQPRLLRGNNGLHWHTNDVMVLHDKDCNIVMDHGRGLLAKPYHWIKNIMILNKWMLRSKKKMKTIVKYRQSRELKGGKCEYKKRNGD